MKKRYITTIILEVIAICFIAASIWLPRRIALNRVVTTDEIQWFYRSGSFNSALNEEVYIKTYQREHPGVTVMWAGSTAYDNVLRKYQITYPEYGDRVTRRYFVDVISRQDPLEILVEGRKILALIHTITLMLAYWYTRRLIGIVPALLGFTLIAFDPFHIALTRIMHPDGLIANFYILSLLAYLNYLQERNFLSILISGISAGLAWLTKSPGLILLPTIGIVALLQLWQNTRSTNQSSWKEKIWQTAWPLAIWGISGVLVFIALWPAMWVAPFEVLSNVLGMAQTYASEGHSTGLYFNGQIIQGDEFGLRYFYFYPITFLWRSTPLVLIGILVFVLGTILQIKPLADPQIHWFSKTLLLAILIYTIVFTFGQKKVDRYILPVYAPMDILGGLGWYTCILWLKDKLQFRTKMIIVLLTLGMVILLQAVSSLSIFPDMLAYYNPLMGGGRKAPYVMQIGWGEGLDKAALYLNQKTNAENLVVSSWYGTGPFSLFFNGETVNIPGGEITDERWQQIISSDYILAYIHQWQRNMPEKVLSELADRKPEHTIWINGMEYVRIYKQRER